MSQFNYLRQKKETNSFVLCLFSIQVFNGLDDALPHGKDNLLYRVHQFKCLFHPETSAETHMDIMFNLSIPWPVKLTHKINFHIQNSIKYEEFSFYVFTLRLIKIFKRLDSSCLNRNPYGSVILASLLLLSFSCFNCKRKAKIIIYSQNIYIYLMS